MSYSVVSLFSGAGGLDMGFANKDFNILWANDIDKDACATHKLWAPKTIMVNENIKKIDLNSVPDSDVIIGGFPCLTGDSLILTDTGYRNLIDIKVGDIVLSHDNYYHRVLNFFKQGIKPIYELVSNFNRIKATINHKFYVRVGSLGDLEDPKWLTVEELMNLINNGIDCYFGCPYNARKNYDYIVNNSTEPFVCKGDYLWYPIKEIIDLKRNEEVYDIEVEDSHSFIVDGCTSHNCQGFSLAGPRKLDDSRNSLYKFFVDLVELKQPKVFLAENVKGILTLGDGEIIEAIKEDFKSKGYKIYIQLFNVSDYGVPQDRERVIIVGIRNDIKEEFKFPEKLSSKVTLKEGLKGIKFNDSDVCKEPYSSRFMSRNRIRTWDEQSFTIPAMAKQVPLHPSSPSMIKIDKDKWEFGKGTTRRFSYKECAAIQTFPKNMIFEGNLTSKYKQIGNAVPVKFAECLAESIKNYLDIL